MAVAQDYGDEDTSSEVTAADFPSAAAPAAIESSDNSSSRSAAGTPRLSECAADYVARLAKELQPEGLLQEILISALGRHAAGMELGSASEASALDYVTRQPPIGFLLGGASDSPPPLPAAISNELVIRTARYRSQHERAFFAALRNWLALRRSTIPAAILDLFKSEDECLLYLRDWQLGQKWFCAACGNAARYWLASRAKFECVCRRQYSVRLNTIYANSHVPLMAWFSAVAGVVLNPAVRASDLAGHISVVRHATLSKMLSRIRQVINTPGGEEQLGGLPGFVVHRLLQVHSRNHADKNDPVKLREDTTIADSPHKPNKSPTVSKQERLPRRPR